MEKEKDPVKIDSKRVYRRPQLTQFGAVANITKVQSPSTFDDNEFGASMGQMFPPGIGS